MTTIAKPLLNAVTQRTIDFQAIVDRARGGPEEPYPIYEFGNGRKRFMSNLTAPSIYDKPVSITNGVTTHLPDPDLVSTNP